MHKCDGPTVASVHAVLINVIRDINSGVLVMFDFRSYFRRPISTPVAIAKDPIEAGIWFHEQYAAHREGHTPPDLYKPDEDWEVRLHRLVKLASPDVITSEFWELWAAVIRE